MRSHNIEPGESRRQSFPPAVEKASVGCRTIFGEFWTRGESANIMPSESADGAAAFFRHGVPRELRGPPRRNRLRGMGNLVG